MGHIIHRIPLKIQEVSGGAGGTVKDPRVWKSQPGAEKDVNGKQWSAWSVEWGPAEQERIKVNPEVTPPAIDERVPGAQHFTSLLCHGARITIINCGRQI